MKITKEELFIGANLLYDGDMVSVTQIRDTDSFVYVRNRRGQVWFVHNGNLKAIPLHEAEKYNVIISSAVMDYADNMGIEYLHHLQAWENICKYKVNGKVQ